MKQMNRSVAVIIASFITMMVFSSCSTAQQTAGKEPVSVSIDSSRWMFTVNMVQPQQGMTQQPNGTYDVQFKPGNLYVYLPYFGRAFNAAEVYGTSKSALDFTSRDFTVEKEQQGEGKWRIVVKPKDQPQVQSMTFTVFSNGSGSLDIIMTNRTPISYTGRVGMSKS